MLFSSRDAPEFFGVVGDGAEKTVIEFHGMERAVV